MRIYKPTYNAKQSDARKTKKYYVEFRDHGEGI